MEFNEYIVGVNLSVNAFYYEINAYMHHVRVEIFKTS